MKRNEVLFLAIGGLESARLEATEVESKVSKHPKPHFLLVAALIALTLLLVGCAVIYATTIFGSPAEMIAGLYGEKTGFNSAPPTEAADPNRPESKWTVPGYEKAPVEETVAKELEKWVSPVGQSISKDGYKLTVEAYVYDSATQCGFMTMLLEHESPISEEALLVGYNGEIGGLSGNYLYFNQYGRAYLIPEKTTDTQLAFTYYFRGNVTDGTNLLVSFPDFEEQAKMDEDMQQRKVGIQEIRQRLKQELSTQEAAEKMRSYGYGGGYTGEYDDYYYLAAYEYDASHSEQWMSQEARETQALEEQLRDELTPEQAVEQLRTLWGDAAMEEWIAEYFSDQMDILPDFAYSTLSSRAYEQAHLEEMICVSLPNSGSLPCKTFGQGDVYVNSLCVRVKASGYSESRSDLTALTFHLTDGTDFVVQDAVTQNTLFCLSVERGDILYMLNSAVNIDRIASVEVVGNLRSALLEADAS